MFGIDISTLIVFVGIAAAFYFLIVPKVVGVKQGVETRRGRSVKLATWAEANGLPVLGNLFGKYAIGDLSGVWASLDQLHDILGNDELAKQSIDGFLKVQFEKRLSTAEGREQLIKLLEEKFNVEIPRDKVAALAQSKQKLKVDEEG